MPQPYMIMASNKSQYVGCISVSDGLCTNVLGMTSASGCAKSGHSQTCLASHTFKIEYYSTEILIHIVVHVYQDYASSGNI